MQRNVQINLCHRPQRGEILITTGKIARGRGEREHHPGHLGGTGAARSRRSDIFQRCRHTVVKRREPRLLSGPEAQVNGTGSSRAQNEETEDGHERHTQEFQIKVLEAKMKL